MSVIEVSVEFGGRQLTLQTGKFAKQTDASVMARYGDTMVLVTAVAAKTLKAGQEFFPLTVDFQEKYYSAGKIPGGFFKREAKPSDKATLSARIIDRPIRPLFPEDFMCETNVVATILSMDPDNEPDVVAGIAASAALFISDIPWAGPVATCRVGKIDDKFVINPSPTELLNSSLELLVSGVPTGVVMVEGSAKEISEKEMMDALDFAHESMKPIFALIQEFREKTGNVPKRAYEKPVRDEALKAEIKKETWSAFEKAFSIREKLSRYEALDVVKKAAKKKFEVTEPKTDADKARNSLIPLYYEELKATYARESTLKKKSRIDGRSYSDIRNITCDVAVLPRVHGSALFTRGETQVLSAITLGTSDDEQKIDSIAGTYQKTFMLHYNFPPFSVGEARPLRPPGRREIGHGFLAERALSYVIPTKDKFPYTVRLVSEVLESNGSSSMATVCSGSMALMDAGVPIPKPVAGVAMGLIKEGDDIAVLSDILGDEDHLGDMDFKVCGTDAGITAFQMDLKIGGVSREIMEQALEQAKQGRLHILDKMNAAISEPKVEMSPYAPRLYVMKIKQDKIREVIGSGGKVIRSIVERTGVKIDIQDDGTINIASADAAAAQKAITIIEQIIEEPEPGRIYEGKITRIAEFGAFVEIIPGTEGLCHISELAHYRVRRVDDIVKEGEIIKVKCLEVDPSGKIRLSRKALLNKDGDPIDGGETPKKRESSESTGSDDQPEPGNEGNPGQAAASAEGEQQDLDSMDPQERIELMRSEGREIENREAEGSSRRPQPILGARGDRDDRGDRGGDRDRGGRDRRPSSGGGRGGYGDRDSGGRGPRGPRRTGGGDRYGSSPSRSGGRSSHSRSESSPRHHSADRDRDHNRDQDRDQNRDRGNYRGNDEDRGNRRPMSDRPPERSSMGGGRGGSRHSSGRASSGGGRGGHHRGPSDRGGDRDRGGYDRGGQQQRADRPDRHPRYDYDRYDRQDNDEPREDRALRYFPDDDDGF